MAANVIYRGPVSREPETLNVPISVAALPGTVVVESDGSLAKAGSGQGRLLLLSNRRFYGQGVGEAYLLDATWTKST